MRQDNDLAAIGGMADGGSQHSSGWADEELVRRLVAKGLLAQSDLNKAIGRQRETHETLAEVITKAQLLPKQVVYEELARVYEVPFVDLVNYEIDRRVLSILTERFCQEMQVCPLFAIGDTLTVAVANPGDIMVIDRVGAESKHNVETCLAVHDDIRRAITRAYGGQGAVKEFLDTIRDDTGAAAMPVEPAPPTTQSSESPITRLVDLILTQAVRDRASDVHFDPQEDRMVVRFRIDGVLCEIPALPKHLYPFLVSRLKVMSNMDIAESRVPQDGHFRMTIDGRTVETRVASVPTVNGEKISIRLLDMDTMAIELGNLGIPERLLPGVAAMVKNPHGIIVVTGPTGSGKSTTLYAMLAAAQSPERHIITIEDPVERRIKMANQIQVNEKTHLTFAAALRSILRQDPDVIMVGEIRDQETAQLSVRAALTGHLVFSTVHTNDAPSVVTRMINLNIDPFLIASSLVGALAQRLVRCICRDCRETVEVANALRTRLLAAGITLPAKVWRGKGCGHCRSTGFRGRAGVFELLRNTPVMAELITGNAPLALLREQARKDGMVLMLENGFERVAQGVTTVEEVLRIAELEGAVEPTAAPVVAAPTETKGRVDLGLPADGVDTANLDLDDYQQRMAGWLSGTSR